MDLTRGICVLCTNITKIIIPPQAEDTTTLIKEILVEQIDYEKFDEINTTLRVCPICLHDILTVAKLKRNINEEFSEDRVNCALCYTEKNLVYITEWANFDKILENVRSEKRLSKCSTCLNCIKCLDLMERMKTNLFKKYPRLELSDKKKKEILRNKKVQAMTKSNKYNHQEVEKGYSSKNKVILANEWSCLSSKKNINNLKAALKHLKPLKNTEYKIDEFKRDKKLLKQIAFVKLIISNLSTNNYKKSEIMSNTAERDKSNRAIILSDTDSLRDTPSPKQSFFKIRLKIKSNKKAHKVASGKVTKAKNNTKKIMLGSKKELMVKILKMNFDKITEQEEDKEACDEIRTPTKASRKLMSDDCVSSSKKRKSVTFADVLDTEIPERASRKDQSDATPLKSLLKKSDSPTSDLLRNGHEGASDKFDNESNKTSRPFELDADSDEDLGNVKGYVEEILKNNDDIFNSLKTEIAPTEKRSSDEINSGTSDSEDNDNTSVDKSKHNKNSKQEKNKKLLEAKKNKNRKNMDSENRYEINSNTSDSEDNDDKSVDKSKKYNKNRKQENDEKLFKNMDSDISHSESIEDKSDDGKSSNSKKQVKSKVASIEEKEKKTKKNVTVIGSDSDDSEKHNSEDEPTESSTHNENCDSPISEPEEQTQDDDRSKDPLEIEIVQKEISNSPNSDTVNSNIEHETSSSETDKDTIDANENPLNNSSEASSEDAMITLEEFKKFKKYNENKESEQVDGKDTPNEGTIMDTELINDNEDIDDQNIGKVSEDKSEDNGDIKIPNNDNVNENNETDNESDLERINKINGPDSSNLKTKSRKRRKSIVDVQDEDEEILKKSRGDVNLEEPETKCDKVSEVDDQSNFGLEKDTNASETKNKDKSLGITEEPKSVGTADCNIDELIAKYTNPSIPNLNNDNNVSDIQNAGVSGKSKEPGSELSSGEAKEIEDKDTNKKEKNVENIDENVPNLIEKNSVGDITANSDVIDNDNVTLKHLDLDNILDNVVDSC